MEGPLIITKWKSNQAISTQENFLISRLRQLFQIKEAVMLHIPTLKLMIFLEKASIDPRCLMGEFKVLDQDIVHLLKIKLAVSLKKTDTKYL